MRPTTQPARNNRLARQANSVLSPLKASSVGLLASPSRKIDNHIYALSLYFVFYNFVKTHAAHRVSPAMAAGVADRLWSMEDIAVLIDARAPKLGRRGPYKKQAKEN